MEESNAGRASGSSRSTESSSRSPEKGTNSSSIEDVTTSRQAQSSATRKRVGPEPTYEDCSEKPVSRSTSKRSTNEISPAMLMKIQRMNRQGEYFSSKKLKARVVRALATFLNGRFMTAGSVILTFYALVGDDLRLLTTNKPSDILFNGLTIVCLTFFTLELVLSSIAKQDYFLGFFFSLDLVSTASLLLDLTWVSSALESNDDMAAGNQARSGRTARLGGSIGRVVRVMRLIRIVKLYKAYYDLNMRKAPVPASEPGEEEDDWDRADAGAVEEHKHGDSQVGKKLVGLTTRRVIVLVLAMLLVLPLLSVDSSHVLATSAAYGADSVSQSFRKYQSGNITQTLYEEALLKYIYYHNWFLGNTKCINDEYSCSSSFYAHVFWVGFAAKDKNKTLLRTLASEATPRAATVRAWNAAASSKMTAYSLGGLPQEAMKSLDTPWDVECEFSSWTHVGSSLLETVINGYVDYVVRCPSDLRPQERFRMQPNLISPWQFDQYHLAFFFDARPFVKAECRFNIITTFFICFVLCVASMQFSKDANKLVLRPVERMIEKVNKIRDNPLIAMKISDDEFKGEEVRKYRATVRNKYETFMESRSWLAWLLPIWFWMKAAYVGDDQDQNLMETAVLEKTIIKLGSLLALGFGEAGAKIVAHNMHGDTAGINAMIPGSRVQLIIGSARIRDFSTATEVLQGKVMAFANQIAEIVHGIVCEFGGAPNKNTGGRFLMIWHLTGATPSRCTRMADMAVTAFVRILGCIHNSRTLAEYRYHPGLKQRLGKDCRVNLSFGLHSGWAIEGAVGSEFKIDASYLSPNVSIAESVEDATQVYNVSIMATETVIELCSKELASKCRLVDKVNIKGSKTPLQLYCVDLDFRTVRLRTFSTKLEWSLRQRFKARQILEAEKERKLTDHMDIVYTFWAESHDVTEMRKAFTTEFMHVFNMGYQNYSQGEWQVARRLLTRTLDMLGFKDGPSGALLSFMDTSDYQAPAKWDGIADMRSTDHL
ncbi:unnamed protein product [Polarella glacialis]|uniref:Guanylate cyclase domain-containing protein n=1 Tax=Polarella glacialis TaxID=89957 RepID=A0A813FWP0_POLGL|nr:unnamed protein product [Polarella glacialis]CAE8685313.1 unnamed protein product [Polarella glacialis]